MNVSLDYNEHLRDGFCKDRASLGTVCKRFSDFAENAHLGVFWAENTKNLVKIFLKNFCREIWREIWIFVCEKGKIILLCQNLPKFSLKIDHSIRNWTRNPKIITFLIFNASLIEIFSKMFFDFRRFLRFLRFSRKSWLQFLRKIYYII